MALIRILAFGDIAARAGRDALLSVLPDLRAEFAADLVIVNVDNAAGGFGVTPEICNDFLKNGSDILTGGNHVFDQKNILPLLSSEPRLLRPANYHDPHIAGRGVGVHHLPDGTEIIVIHLLGELFMGEGISNPFWAIDDILKKYPLTAKRLIIVDFHAEATSEKRALAHFVDGRVTAVFGTHTHIPTADAHVLQGGTGYQTDIGMCGPYQSVIGMKEEIVIQRFLGKQPRPRLESATSVGSICGVLIIADSQTGKCVRMTPLRKGEGIEATWPTI